MEFSQIRETGNTVTEEICMYSDAQYSSPSILTSFKIRLFIPNIPPSKENDDKNLAGT